MDRLSIHVAGIHVSNNVTYLQATTPAGHEHDPALLALLYLPIAVFLVMFAIEAGYRAGVPAAIRMRAGYQALGPTSRLALLLISMTAWTHLALAPSHWEEDRLLAILFVLNGLALGGVALGALVVTRWRGTAAFFLGASLIAYAFYVLTGREDFDAVGGFTKVVEAAALVLVLFGPRAEQPSTLPGLARSLPTRR